MVKTSEEYEKEFAELDKEIDDLVDERYTLSQLYNISMEKIKNKIREKIKKGNLLRQNQKLKRKTRN